MKFRYGGCAIMIILVGCSANLNSGSSATPAPVGSSVTGDMLAVSGSRGWNYSMSVNGQKVTGTLYADPSSGNSHVLVLLVTTASQSNAIAGTKEAAATMNASGGQYNAANYTLYNADGSVWANGAVPGTPVLVPSTLSLGQSFNPYAGVSATVTAVGSVPGVSGCPTPASGATVHYTYGTATYDVSYVPGCGVTSYADSSGNAATLTSVSSYPQLGTLGDIAHIQHLSILDDVASVVRIGLSKDTWHSLLRKP